MFTIEYVESVSDDLAALRAFERNQILDRIEEQLTAQPTESTRNKKIVRGLHPLGTRNPGLGVADRLIPRVL